MKHKGYLLDIDNTFYDYEAAHQPAMAMTLDYVSEMLGLDRSTVEQAFSKAKHSIHQEFIGTAAMHHRLFYFQLMLENLGKDVFLASVFANRYWDSFFSHMILRPDALKFLQVIQGAKICVITDLLADLQFRKMHHLGLTSFVQAIVTSEEAKCEKPNPKIFTLAQQKIKIPFDSICMVGDDWSKDVLGAVAMGASAYYLQNQSQIPTEIPNGVKTFPNFAEMCDFETR